MVTLTPKAAEYVKKLIKKEVINMPPGGIRFGVKSGGCSGFQYYHELIKQDDRHDHIIWSLGVRVIVDPKSMTIMRGTEVDHTDNLLDQPFTYNNPNAKQACGCGTSFELR